MHTPIARQRFPFAVVAYARTAQPHCPSGTVHPIRLEYAQSASTAERIADATAADPTIACVRTFQLDTSAQLDPWGRFRYQYDTFRTGPHVTDATFA